MAAAPSKLYSDDVSLLVVLIDTNPFFWGGGNVVANTSFSFSTFLAHVLAFLNSILLLNKLNQVVIIATGINSCNYIYDSSFQAVLESSENGRMSALSSKILEKLEEFVVADERLSEQKSPLGTSSLLSGSLSLALCYIQRVFRSGSLHPQPRVPIDSCVVGSQHSAFLQQACYITGGAYLKPPHLDGLFQYLSTVFGTDLHSRSVLELPKPAGVDFRASCFCHKKTIDMGYICSVCLSIFCQHHKKCSTCGSVFGEAHPEANSTPDKKRKTPAS